MTSSRSFTRLLNCSLPLLILILGGTSGRSGEQRATAPVPASPSTTTPQDCAVCHEDIAKAFATNPHEALEKSPLYQAANPCESCHGPGKDHIESGGEASKIISFEAKDFKTYNSQCLKCHRNDQQIRGFPATRHAKEKLSCVDCHKNHNAALMTHLLRERPSTLCMGCHTLKRTEFSKPYHHRVREGAMDCIDCHQPHSSLERRNVRYGFSGEEVCFKCHSEKEGPFVFEHAGVRINSCTGCHQPHGSNNPKMLIRNPVYLLCLECHSAGSNVLTSSPPTFHNLSNPVYRNCTVCHAMIHGSNFDPFFFR